MIKKTKKNMIKKTKKNMIKKTKRKTKKKKHSIPKRWQGIGGDGDETMAKELIQSCPHSVQCLAFGQQVDKIKKLFNDFDFQYAVVKDIKAISEGSFGFVIEIPYERYGYRSYAALKSIIKGKDFFKSSLLREAYVGVYINTKLKKYPCFVETYGCYLYEPNLYNKMVKIFSGKNLLLPFNAKDLKKGLKPFTKMNYASFLDADLISESCEKYHLVSILIQDMKYAPTLQSCIKLGISKEDTKNEFVAFHLMNYLYQVYCPLSIMKKENGFFHKDLHTGNILIYKPGKKEKDMLDQDIKEFITMKYHYPGPGNEIITINTFGIAKIIDYAYCTFYKNENEHSGLFFQIENAFGYPENTNKCFQYNKIIKRDNQNIHNFDIDTHESINHNDTHIGDLYLMANERTGISRLGQEYASQIINNVVKYIKEMPINETNQEIENVQQMHQVLKNYIQGSKVFQDLNTSLFDVKKGYICLGVMDIWVDGTKDMVYTPIP